MANAYEVYLVQICIKLDIKQRITILVILLYLIQKYYSWRIETCVYLRVLPIYLYYYILKFKSDIPKYV